MPGLVHAITYIKPPTAFEYGTCNIYSRSASVEGDNCAESLKWEAEHWKILFAQSCQTVVVSSLNIASETS